MIQRASITKDESNILVAIGKIETQMDGLRIDVAGARAEIKEINTGITARLLNLEANSVSKIEVNPKLDDHDERITNLEDSRIAYKASLKVWVILGGGTWSIAVVAFSVWLATVVHT